MQNYFFILKDFVGTLLSPAKHINNQARSDLPYNVCDNRLYFLKKFGTNIVVLENARPGLLTDGPKQMHISNRSQRIGLRIPTC